MKLQIDRSKLVRLCERWRIIELSFFGSVLRPDFGPTSDVDVLVKFDPGAEIGFFDFLQIQDELGETLKRKVDLVSEGGLNTSSAKIIAQQILGSAEKYYVAG